MRSTAKLCLAVLAVFGAFAGITTAGASAGVVCVQGDNPAEATAVFYDSNDPNQQGCNNQQPPSGTDETHQLTVTLGTGSDPQNPGGTTVQTVTFQDSNPIVSGDNNPPAAGENVCTVNGNTATCKARFYTFALRSGNDTVTVSGTPTPAPDAPVSGPPSCSTGSASGSLVFGDFPDMGAGNDTYNGSEGSDGVSAGLGDDTVNGNAGADVLEGGPGADAVHGNDGNDCIDGGTGNDPLTGDAGNDSLDCSGGPGSLGDSSDGDDTEDAGDGNDVLCPGTGPRNDTSATNPNPPFNPTAYTLVTDADTLIGGPGLQDSVSYDNFGHGDFRVPITETENGAADDGSAAHPDRTANNTGQDAARPDLPPEGDNLGSDVENIRGGDGPNTIVANDQDNNLSGGFMNDNIQGLGGDDDISGNGGCFQNCPGDTIA